MGNSLLRPETVTAKPGTPSPTNGTAYLVIYNAVKRRAGLIHGKLDNKYGEHCAIGSYFDDHPRSALNFGIIDEVAMVNDSVPTATAKQRRLVVMRWLRWKLAQVGMPGFVVVKPTAKK